jgi:hypothetical protein
MTHVLDADGYKRKMTMHTCETGKCSRFDRRAAGHGNRAREKSGNRIAAGRVFAGWSLLAVGVFVESYSPAPGKRARSRSPWTHISQFSETRPAFSAPIHVYGGRGGSKLERIGGSNQPAGELPKTDCSGSSVGCVTGVQIGAGYESDSGRGFGELWLQQMVCRQ